MRCRPRIWFVAGLLLALLACSQHDEYSKNQAYFFLESLKQVDSGGRQLQNADLDEAALQQALMLLDEGLQLAFQVERKFLDELDLRLGKNYQRYFIEGVENYRIGIEAGNQEQQLEGLRLLQQWAVFWGEAGDAIRNKLPSG